MRTMHPCGQLGSCLKTAPPRLAPSPSIVGNPPSRSHVTAVSSVSGALALRGHRSGWHDLTAVGGLPGGASGRHDADLPWGLAGGLIIARSCTLCGFLFGYAWDAMLKLLVAPRPLQAFLCCLGAVYALTFANLLLQWPLLVGSRGLMPVDAHLTPVASKLTGSGDYTTCVAWCRACALCPPPLLTQRAACHDECDEEGAVPQPDAPPLVYAVHPGSCCRPAPRFCGCTEQPACLQTRPWTPCPVWAAFWAAWLPWGWPTPDCCSGRCGRCTSAWPMQGLRPSSGQPGEAGCVRLRLLEGDSVHPSMLAAA